MANRPHPCLFLGEVPGRRDTIEFLDPSAGHGRANEDNIERLAAALGDETIDSAILQIEPDRAEQAVVVCFDASASMNGKLDGHETITRLAFAKQGIHTLIARTWAYRVGSCFGLVTFEDRVETPCELTYDMQEFENRLNEVKPTGKPHLWDALAQAATAHEAYHWDERPGGAGDDHRRGRIHPNAVLRIIVISDGEDSGSLARPEDVLTQRLLSLRIIVDAVIVSHGGENAPLGALCEMTGGVATKAPQAPEEGLGMFEQEGFLNMKVRCKKIPAKPPVTADQSSRSARSGAAAIGTAQRSRTTGSRRPACGRRSQLPRSRSGAPGCARPQSGRFASSRKLGTWRTTKARTSSSGSTTQTQRR
jgi:Mg-chelatase subunit ChlD